MSSQSSVGHESDLKGDKCCFLVEELNQYVEGQLRSSLPSGFEGVVPPLQVIVRSDGFHIHAPSCWWEGTIDNPVVIHVLAKGFQGLCCRSSLEVIKTSFYFFCWQERLSHHFSHVLVRAAVSVVCLLKAKLLYLEENEKRLINV